VCVGVVGWWWWGGGGVGLLAVLAVCPNMK